MTDAPRTCFNRRGFLAATTATPLAGLAGLAAAQDAPPAAPPVGRQPAPATGPEPVPAGAEDGAHIFLNNPEADTLRALVDRLIPAGPEGPGAIEVGVLTFIDRQLAGAFGVGDKWYMRGPFPEGTPGQGWQYAFTPGMLYKHALGTLERIVRAEHGRGVAELDAGERDALLHRMEAPGMDLGGIPASVFFDMLLQNTMEGYFSDPVYGGNRGGATWKHLGYPGANPVRNDLVGSAAPYDGDPVSIG